MEPHLTDEEIRELMLDAVEPMDPAVEARMLARIEAMLDAREAGQEAEQEVEQEAELEPAAPVQPIPVPRRKLPRALVIAPFALAGLLMAAMALVAVAWLLFKGGGVSNPGLEERPSERPRRTGQE